MSIDHKKSEAQRWFRELRDRLVARFEGIEASMPASRPFTPEGRTPTFTITPWQREEGGGGEMGMMKGRVFEKVGINISTVTGEFSEQFRREIPGAANDPRFWASGISLVAHMSNPKVPAAHFNTRMIVVGDGARIWFGGGGDLNPMVANDGDTAQFHAAFHDACDAHDPLLRPHPPTPDGAGTSLSREAGEGTRLSERSELSRRGEGSRAAAGFYDAFSAWCDEYFFLPHRKETRGVGGIFYDYLGLNTLGTSNEPIAPGQFGKGGLGKERTAHGMQVAANAPMDWQQCFDFTQAVGEAFLSVYPAIIEQRMHESFTDADREHQLHKRGRYAEYNLLYDRGTRFGLMTGGNPEAILMSLPPIAKWN